MPVDTYLCLKISEDVFPETAEAGERNDESVSQIQHVAFRSTLPWSPPASRIGSTCCRRAPGRCGKCLGFLVTVRRRLRYMLTSFRGASAEATTTCSVCLDHQGDEWIALRCGHVYHRPCLGKQAWLGRPPGVSKWEASCPQCRKRFTVKICSPSAPMSSRYVHTAVRTEPDGSRLSLYISGLLVYL